MTDRPILFSAPMARALLAGTKTQTRRIIKPQPISKPMQPLISFNHGVPEYSFGLADQDARGLRWWRCPYGVPGDRLWVRETIVAESKGVGDGVRYPADKNWQGIENTKDAADRWLTLFHYGKRRPPMGERIGPSVPGIHMPRWTSRLWLTITGVRVQRLQEISEADARAEGITELGPQAKDRMREFGIEDTGPDRSPIIQPTAARAYRFLWGQINGPDSWDANPWVWAVSFDVHRGNIGALS